MTEKLSKKVSQDPFGPFEDMDKSLEMHKQARIAASSSKNRLEDLILGF